MWGEEFDLDSAMRGDVNSTTSRVRVLVGIAVLAAVAVAAIAGLIISNIN